MIHFCCHPNSLFTNVFSKISQYFLEQGMNAKYSEIGSKLIDVKIQAFFSAKISNRIRHLLYTSVWNYRLLRTIRAGDIVWIYTNGEFISRIGLDASLEKAIKRKNARYIFQLPDAWPLFEKESKIQKGCERRARMADLSAPVTPQLNRLLRDKYGNIPCETCEEAFDTDVFNENDLTQDYTEKVVIWSGPPTKLDELEPLFPVFLEVYGKIPFKLRIISGISRPNLSIPIPWEWLPFPGQSQLSQAYQGAIAAIASYPRQDEYGLCKGNYKIKNYMAAGKAIVTSPLGYNSSLINDGENGLFASGSDEWRDSLFRILTDEALGKRLGRNARETAIRRFSCSSIAAQYMRILKQYFPAEMQKTN